MSLEYCSDDMPLTYANGHDSLTLSVAEDAAETVAERRSRLLRRYIALLEQHPEGLTDHEAAALLGVPNTSCCSTRSALRDRVGAIGAKAGPWGARNSIFGLVGMAAEVEVATC